MAREGFVDVYSSTTGDKLEVPEHWMEDKLLSKPFRKTPLQKRADAEAASKAPVQKASDQVE